MFMDTHELCQKQGLDLSNILEVGKTLEDHTKHTLQTELEDVQRV